MLKGRAYLDTSMVTNLDIVNKITLGNDNTCTFVATDKGKLGCKRPVAIDGVQVGVTDTGVLDVDENFVRTGLLDRDLLVLDWSTGLLNDLCPLHLGNLGCHYGKILDLYDGWL